MIPTVMEMELAIARTYDVRSHWIVPNISWGLHFGHEIDVLIVRSSGYCIEVEIKRSKSDLKADFKKKKWKKGYVGMIMGKRIKEFFYCLPEELYDDCIKLIPESAGVMVLKKGYGRVHIKRKSKINMAASPISNRDLTKLGQLSMMRIWNLQRTLINKIKEQKDRRKSVKSNK